MEGVTMKLKIQTLIVGCIVALCTQTFARHQTLFSRLETTVGTSPSTITKPNYPFASVGGSTVFVEFPGQAQSNERMASNEFRLGRAPGFSSLLLLAGLVLLVTLFAYRHTNRLP